MPVSRTRTPSRVGTSTGLASASGVSSNLYRRCWSDAGYGCACEAKPIHVLPAPFGTTWRICLSSNGPPLRMIITSPPSGVAIHPVAPKVSTSSAMAATATITMFLTIFTPPEYPE